jgi:hypothetical protein
MFENPNTCLITKLLWTKQFEKFPPQEHGHAKAWEAAKTAVATYLLYETNELRIKDSPITKLKNTIRITHDALNKLGPSPILTAKVNHLHANSNKLGKPSRTHRSLLKTK